MGGLGGSNFKSGLFPWKTDLIGMCWCLDLGSLSFVLKTLDSNALALKSSPLPVLDLPASPSIPSLSAFK